MCDVRDRGTRDRRTAEAVALSCCQVRRWIGRSAAAPGRLHTPVPVFGNGRNAPAIRAGQIAVCATRTDLVLRIQHSVWRVQRVGLERTAPSGAGLSIDGAIA